MAKGKNQHVVKRDNGWAVLGELNTRDTVVKPTQREAFEAARVIARNQRSEVKIHGRNGQIRAGHSYGPDPNPPKG